MTKIAIVGATGPTGIHLVAELRKTAAAVRVIARDGDKLAQLFPEAAVEKRSADILDANATLRAIDGCDLAYDCIGLPGDQMHLHPVIARNIAGALRQTKARCIQVSSYWAYYPQVPTQMNESHPRRGGPPWVRYRREAEDVLCEAGAAILHLPDFYGPHVHVSTLQNALNEAASGKTVNWLGSADTQREYLRAGRHAHRCRCRSPHRGLRRALVPARRPTQRSAGGRDRQSSSRETGQTALDRVDDAANCKSVQQGFARAAAGRPRLYEVSQLRHAKAATPARAAADDLLCRRYWSDPYLDFVEPLTA